jgi:hypothetical protein
LLIADGQDFDMAGGWQAPRAPGTTIVLVGAPPPKSERLSDSGVHHLRGPVKPARLRALCHFALTRSRSRSL